MLNPRLIAIAQIIKSKAVLLFIHNIAKLSLQRSQLSRIEQTFKNAVLHPLSVIDTLLCDTPQSAFTGCVCGGHVIADEYKHFLTYFHKNGG